MPAIGLAAVGNSAWIASGSSSEGTQRNVALLWEAAHVTHTFVWPCLVGYVGLHAIEAFVLQPTTYELDQMRMRLAAIQKECKQLKEEALELQTRAEVGATIEETVRIRPRRRRALIPDRSSAIAPPPPCSATTSCRSGSGVSLGFSVSQKRSRGVSATA